MARPKGEARLYGVFFCNGRWGMTTNKRTAIKAVKAKGGGEVRSVSYGYASSWDSPTFRLLSDLVYKL